MKRSIFVAGIGMALTGPATNGALALQSATAECQAEAISTGLEQEGAIQAYVNQCMQRFAGLPEFEAATSNAETEPGVDESMLETEPVN